MAIGVETGSDSVRMHMNKKFNNADLDYTMSMLEKYNIIKNWKCLPRPAAVEASTGAYLDDNNPLKSWLEEHYDKTGRTADHISSTQMIQEFAMDTGTERMDSKKFKKMMEFNGFDSKRLTHCSCAFVGLKRKEETL